MIWQKRFGPVKLNRKNRKKPADVARVAERIMCAYLQIKQGMHHHHRSFHIYPSAQQLEQNSTKPKSPDIAFTVLTWPIGHNESG